jgi:hypothetical protein
MFALQSKVINLLNGQFQANSLDKLSLTNHPKVDVQNWVNRLPMLNVGQTGKELFTTLSELLLVKLPESNRFELIEVLRPAINRIIESLAKNYNFQSITVDQRAERISVLVQQLRAYSAMIYSGVAIRSADKLQKDKLAFFQVAKKKAALNLISKAIHRGLTEFYYLLSHTRTLQRSDSEGMWLRIHELYKLSVDLGLNNFSYDDEKLKYGKTLTIEQVYIRSVLLSLCKTEQLRQGDAKIISQMTELWSGLIKISTDLPDGQYPLLVDTSVDTPASHVSEDKETSSTIVRFDTSTILRHFESLHRNLAHAIHADEKTLLSKLLLMHLIQIFEPRKDRLLDRLADESMLYLEIGLIASHYQLSGLRSFEEVIQTQHIISNQGQENILSDGDHTSEEAGQESEINDYLELHRGQIVNSSSGGFCIRWVGTPPNILRSGELICIKKDKDAPWHIGVIRWVKKQPGVDVEFGVEVLSEHGIACGARVIHKDGYSSDYMRAVLLPKTTENSSSSIIAPTLFSEAEKISIRLGSEEYLVKLNRKTIITNGFSQIEFEILSKDHGFDTNLDFII